jgi:hypothetical protein
MIFAMGSIFQLDRPFFMGSFHLLGIRLMLESELVMPQAKSTFVASACHATSSDNLSTRRRENYPSKKVYHSEI